MNDIAYRCVKCGRLEGQGWTAGRHKKPYLVIEANYECRCNGLNVAADCPVHADDTPEQWCSGDAERVLLVPIGREGS